MKSLKFLILAVFFTFLVNNCNNPFGPHSESKTGKLPAGKGSFSLKIAGAERTIVPKDKVFDDTKLFYELVFTAGSDGTQQAFNRNYNDIEAVVVLDLGTYSLVVNAYKDEAHKQLLLTGTANSTIEIKSNVPATATVTLEPVLEDGTGTFTWDITFPGNVDSAYMEIINRKTNATATETLIEDGSGILPAVATGTLDLPAGFYNIIITMTGDTPLGPKTVTRKEILHIYNGYKSEYEKIFNDVNFNIVYTVTFISDAFADDVEDYFVHGASVPDGYFDAHIPALSSNAYLCEGNDLSDIPSVNLYYDPSYQEPWDMEAGVFTDDITLYAKSPFVKYGFNSSTIFLDNNLDFVYNGSVYYTLFVAEDVNLGVVSINRGINLTVKSAGERKTIYRSTWVTGWNDGLFIVQDGATLTLQNIVMDGKYKDPDGNEDPAFADNRGPLVVVLGQFTLKDKAVLRNNRVVDPGLGGAVKVLAGEDSLSAAVFTMTGGEISGNRANFGGGVCVVGSHANGFAEFTMTGGIIRGNEANNGGGLYLDEYADVTISNGEIRNNMAQNGGGIFCNRGNYRLFVRGTAQIKENNAAMDGGGVYGDIHDPFSYGYLKIGETAVINGNIAGQYGGGVYFRDLLAVGGTAVISGNSAAMDGGGVYANGKLIVGGAPEINENTKNGAANNVYLACNDDVDKGFIVLDMDGENIGVPASGMNIGVRTHALYNKVSTGTGIILRVHANAENAGYFHADDGVENILMLVPADPYSGDMLVIVNAAQLDFYTRVEAFGSATDNVTIAISKDITLPYKVNVPVNSGGHTLTITSADVPKTICRGFEDEFGYTGLFTVPNGAKLVFQNIVVDGNYKNADGSINPSFENNMSSLVYVNGEFTLDGAVLRNNKARGGYYNEGTGGAVSVHSSINANPASFTMISGEITGNEAKFGGGVYIVGSESIFTMIGGTITENTAVSGGGVCIQEVWGAVDMTGGIITKNTAEYGGGVYNFDGGSNMYIGGNILIKENTAVTKGGGVYDQNGSEITIGEAAEVSENTADGVASNVYLSDGRYIILGADFHANIGVQTETYPGVFVYSGATASDAQYFHPDKDTETVGYHDNTGLGQLILNEK